ncbi:MAG: hypothetical protein NTV54_15845 [Ignavibacteriales bacterium]|nr:hypothetical protein [Ignavibacteriales bacterium]
MSKFAMILALIGYTVLAYICILLPIHLYEPTTQFHLPGLLWFIHLITLYIHEAGHPLFGIFGRTIGFMGGSLMQVLVPVVWFFIAKKEGSRLMPVAAFFTGESLVDVSIYVKDASTRVLPLLGGSKVHHDWWTLLGEADMLEWGEPLGTLLFFAGMILCIGAIIWGVKSIIEEYREKRPATGENY